WPERIINEFSIRGVLLSPDLKLTGQIDKIEFLTASESAVNVVDYKTGKPKSRREILGQNKNASGDYGRQLVFYKLLLDRYAGGKYRVMTGELDFIEPDEKGEYRKEKFELDDAMVQDLIKTIERVAGEIRSLKFLNQGCREASCEACLLWRLMGEKLSSR
ncbi:MAG: PD-(D/E)XK nuclease family protein, partial [Patescibacteria group bacterium]